MRHDFALLVTAVLLMAACNSITGTQDANPPVANVPVKNCIDDFRAVHILEPAQGSTVPAEPCLSISWEVLEFCLPWEARVEVSLDGGHTWAQGGWMPHFWSTWSCLGGLPAGTTVMVRVTVRDLLGEVSDTHTFTIGPSGHRVPRIPQERD